MQPAAGDAYAPKQLRPHDDGGPSASSATHSPRCRRGSGAEGPKQSGSSTADAGEAATLTLSKSAAERQFMRTLTLSKSGGATIHAHARTA